MQDFEILFLKNEKSAVMISGKRHILDCTKFEEGFLWNAAMSVSNVLLSSADITTTHKELLYTGIHSGGHT